jgi:hypothetical protein
MNPSCFEDWYSWSFDNVYKGKRINKQSIYQYHISPVDLPQHGTFFEEMYASARLMRDCFRDTFDVLLSGGIDSEIVVRVFKDLKIKHNTYIFRYKNNYNYREVSHAIDIAKCLNIKYKIIDFDLEKFFENEANALFKESRIIHAGRLPHIKFTDYVDNIPIMGEGDPYWRRFPETYDSPGEWKFLFSESSHCCSTYLNRKGRENVCDWYEFTPNLIKSFNDLPIIQDLLADKLTGKISNWSSRLPIFRQQWPDIKDKIKLIGYETDKVSGSYPQFMIDFQNYMEEENGLGNDYWLSATELNSLL